MFKDQIEAGAKLLEDKIGPVWLERQDLEKLDLSDTCNCIVGQACPDKSYLWALMDLLEDRTDEVIDTSIAYGFATEDGRNYPELTQEWKHLITERREQKNVLI